MSETTETKPPPYTSHNVWEHESGERIYVEGHLSPRRAIAAANRWSRVWCGLANLIDDRSPEGVAELDVQVGHRWIRPDPQSPLDDESYAWCDADHPQAEPITVVTW